MNRDGSLKHSFNEDECRLVPLGHWNWKWNAARSKYHTYEHELLGGVLVLASQQRIIGNNPVTWLCDQDSVKYFMDSPPPEQKQLRRWWVFLSQLQIAVRHIQGLKSELSDYLSRNSFDERFGQSSSEMAKDAFAKMDVQLDLFMKTTQPQNKWEKEELLKDYAAIMKQLQPGQVKLIAGEQWAMAKDALCKEDRVCVPESHLEETLRWSHTVNGHPAGQRSLWFFDRHFHCNKNESEKKRLMTEVTKDCHCILGKPNSQVDRGERGNLPICSYAEICRVPRLHAPAPLCWAQLCVDGHVRALQIRVFPMNKKADSETVLKTLFEECIQFYGLPKVIHSDQDVRLTAAGNWYSGVLETLGYEIQFGTPYLRTKNALCERQIRSLKQWCGSSWRRRRGGTGSESYPTQYT